MNNSKKVFLMILDGWGHGQIPSADALLQANTPFMDSIHEDYPNSELTTFGELVGLPKGQMGNSEVGHLNIGAGRVVFQELVRINNAIKDGSLATNKVFRKLIKQSEEANNAFHLLGMLSDGGVHSHINHLLALIDIVEESPIENIYLHLFTDGRDTDPKSGVSYIETLEKHIKGKKAKIATITGRYYAMDRDKRWERVRIAYDAMVKGGGITGADAITEVKKQYEKGVTDEFLLPMVFENEGNIKNGDSVLFFNFRTDRPRELTTVLSQQDMEEYEMKKLNLHFCTMTMYNETFKNIDIIFKKDNLHNTLGETISLAGKTQLRIAETEKYPHVTFFFNGGREKPFDGEKRIMIPSPKVATYDLQPEMSAEQVTQAAMESIETDTPDFICLNFANTDMVGHTGVFEAVIKAAEKIDNSVKRLVTKALEYDYNIIIIADHGNSDFMINENGTPNTAHSLNPVPFIVISQEEIKNIRDGKLADLSPMILKLMEIEAPAEMTGEVLFS